MKLFSENIEDLRTLYVTGLKKALDMEQKITKALPTMIEKSTDTQLASAFRNHLTETQGHVAKVQTLLREAAGDDSTSTCKAISALITEAEDNIKDAAAPSRSSTMKSPSTAPSAAGPNSSVRTEPPTRSRASSKRRRTPIRSSPRS